MAQRILRITSHAGHYRYLDTLTNAGYIVRQSDIPSPYAYSPTHVVYHDPKRGDVFIVETSHKRYDVFRVPANVTIYRTDADATKAKLTEIADRAVAEY
jgi:hypothetical protein